MTYKKLYISATNNSHSESNIEKEHCPELVYKNTTSVGTVGGHREKIVKNSDALRIPIGKIVGIGVLCLGCFLMGCAVTTDGLAKWIKSVAVFSVGASEYSNDDDNHLNNTAEGTDTPTYYQKYMSNKDTDSSIIWENNKDDSEIGDIQGEYTYLTEETAVTAGVIYPDSQNRDTDNMVAVKAEENRAIYTVLSEDMSAADIHNLINETNLSPDTYYLASKKPKALENLYINPDEPTVLVVHTHGTECYNIKENGEYMYSDTAVRSEDTTENVVAVGEVLVSILRDFGIGAIHSTKMCDKDSFVKAYSVSSEEVKGYLNKYPSIKVVIDLHRDAIELTNGTKKKPVFNNAGENTAQLMLVVGTDSAGAKHPDWQENLSFALNLQSEIQSRYPRLFRGINLRSASFNQQLSYGYLLLECGSAANTLEEAKGAAVIFATELARLLLREAV